MPTRILVVEDNPDNLELMSYLLGAFGYATLRATDGEQGLRIARSQQPDLILCDIQLPKVGGHEVARQLKADEQLRAIPLIAVTAYAMVGDREKMLVSGFDGYITKPITPESFVGQVEAYLRPDQRMSPRPNLNETTLPDPSPAPAPMNATILIVDDHPTNREVFAETLRPFGFNILMAAGVPQAMDLAENHPIDLIVSDVNMYQSGFHFIGLVKKHPRLRHIPFIFLSSSCDDSEHRLGLTLGADRFIVRPIACDQLVAEIKACLAHSKNPPYPSSPKD